MGLKQVSFVEKASYLRGSLKSHYIIMSLVCSLDASRAFDRVNHG